MNHSKIASTSALLTAALMASNAAAQTQPRDTLLFSTKSVEFTLSGTGGTIGLTQLGPRAVSMFSQGNSASGGASAEKFLPALAVQTLAGDEDGDGDAHTPNFTGGIDALFVKPYHPRQGRPNGEWQPRLTPVNAGEVFFSVIDDAGTNVSGAPGLRGGDCGRFVRTPAGNGQVEHFIRAEQIISALGIVDQQNGQPVDQAQVQLDAITVTVDGHIFLSLEEDHTLALGAGATFLLEDGAVAWIPASTWIADARGNVQSVAPRSGRIAFREVRVDGFVTNAAIADNAGTCVSMIEDVDGLAVDLRGGFVNAPWMGQVYQVPNLLISGENLTGGGVISTAAGGQIAQLGGAPLAANCGSTTDGKLVGMRDTGSVDSLDGLETLRRRPCRFVLGSPTPTALGTGSVRIEVATDLPVAGVLLLFGIGGAPVSSSISFAPWNPTAECFPELYPAVLGGPSVFVPTPPHAPAGQAGILAPIALPAIAPGILVQAAAITPTGIELSTPITLH